MFTENQAKKIDQLQQRAFMVAIVGLAVAIVGGLVVGLAGDIGLAKVFQPLSIAFMTVFGLVLGSLSVILLHHLCGGSWSFVILRINEASARTLPLFAAVAAIIFLGAAWLTNFYPWTDGGYVEAQYAVKYKAPFLNLPVFTLTLLACFAIWIALCRIYTNGSARLDEVEDERTVLWLIRLAGPGLILFVLTISIASTHWTMSLEPNWFSTIYAVWLIGGYALTVMAFCAIALSYMKDAPGLNNLVEEKHFHHLGNFLLGFTIFWAYTTFSQFLIIWSGNIPDPISFYLRRSEGGLVFITVVMIVFVWLVPMFLLLIRENKTNHYTLRKIAYFVLAMRVVDMYWNIAPSFPDHHNRINLLTLVLTLAALAGLGGLWLWAFLGELKKRPLIPQHDPRKADYFLKHEGDDHAESTA